MSSAELMAILADIPGLGAILTEVARERASQISNGYAYNHNGDHRASVLLSVASIAIAETSQRLDGDRIVWSCQELIILSDDPRADAIKGIAIAIAGIERLDREMKP